MSDTPTSSPISSPSRRSCVIAIAAAPLAARIGLPAPAAFLARRHPRRRDRSLPDGRSRHARPRADRGRSRSTRSSSRAGIATGLRAWRRSATPILVLGLPGTAATAAGARARSATTCFGLDWALAALVGDRARPDRSRRRVLGAAEKRRRRHPRPDDPRGRVGLQRPGRDLAHGRGARLPRAGRRERRRRLRPLRAGARASGPWSASAAGLALIARAARDARRARRPPGHRRRSSPRSRRRAAATHPRAAASSPSTSPACSSSDTWKEQDGSRHVADRGRRRDRGAAHLRAARRGVRRRRSAGTSSATGSRSPSRPRSSSGRSSPPAARSAAGSTRGERTLVAWGGLKGAVPLLLAAYPALDGLDGAAQVEGIVLVATAGVDPPPGRDPRPRGDGRAIGRPGRDPGAHAAIPTYAPGTVPPDS